MTGDISRQKLIRILQGAYSGEMAAAFAYRGHWKSLPPGTERERIRRIEAEEWIHRENVGRWLERLNSKPQKRREIAFWTIGRSLGVSCFVSGWFLPMYFAGRLESGNVKEYEDAAAFAREIGFADCAAEMMEMARVEQEHEDFFLETVASHWLLPLMKRFFGWGERVEKTGAFLDLPKI
ncbi:MAG TPA: ferritin-like domain-containing protein [Pyrinomonadaceae bacterium]|jgi:rubrerythrin|nr:ferritin-like domain-containing protein [Pyrinomonadaceae bacterium]